MSRAQSLFCRSAPWRGVAGRVVLPWSLQGHEPSGQVLEVGAGSGAMAAVVLDRWPAASMTVTDFDPEMVGPASARLSGFGDRAVVRQADATALPFADRSFDLVLSWVMLHHTIDWERALAEMVRVLRPGGAVVGYDLLSTPPLRALHRADERVRLVRLPELAAAVARLDLAEADVTRGLGGLVVRFRLVRGDGPCG
jgi:ubiquinone/menaquinone biosynthesis C-methylase UbiE